MDAIERINKQMRDGANVPPAFPFGAGKPLLAPSDEPDDTPLEERNLAADLLAAAEYVADHGLNVRFDHERDTWIVWDGRRWSEDNAAARRLGHATAERLGRYTQASSAITNMLREASVMEGIPVKATAFNADPYLFNAANGTVDLRTGKLRPHRRCDMLTALCPTAFLADAHCESWEDFLNVIFKGDDELIRYLWKLLGYCLTGLVDEQSLWFLVGGGANGKTTLLSVLFAMLGPDYSWKAPQSLLLAKQSESHPTELASLYGKRFVAAVETPENARLNESIAKELTGADAITARRMREDFWTFQPTHKLAICTNHKPRIRGTDHGIWRRLRIVPFDVCIPVERQDKKLPEKLAGESSGILRWAVDGFRAYQSEGLTPPKAIMDATAAYRSSEDVLGAFLAERCQTGNNAYRATAGDLFAAYREWCERSNEHPVRQVAFGAALADRGFTSRKGAKGTRWWVGIGLSSQGADDEDAANKA